MLHAFGLLRRRRLRHRQTICGIRRDAGAPAQNRRSINDMRLWPALRTNGKPGGEVFMFLRLCSSEPSRQCPDAAILLEADRLINLSQGVHRYLEEKGVPHG